MITYTIEKIEDDIILTLPETATYHNKYRDIYYLNNSKGIQIKRKYQPISTAHLESIKIEAENITSATSDDITFQFRTTTGGIVSVNCGENTSELVSTVTSQLTPQDFYLDAVTGGANNVHIADFINTVLIDVFTNSTVLDGLCADEEVVANPCPDCPDCPECPDEQSYVIPDPATITTTSGDFSVEVLGSPGFKQVLWKAYTIENNEKTYLSNFNGFTGLTYNIYSSLTEQQKAGEFFAPKYITIYGETVQFNSKNDYQETFSAIGSGTLQDTVLEDRLSIVVPPGFHFSVTFVYGNDGVETEYTIEA